MMNVLLSHEQEDSLERVLAGAGVDSGLQAEYVRLDGIGVYFPERHLPQLAYCPVLRSLSAMGIREFRQPVQTCPPAELRVDTSRRAALALRRLVRGLEGAPGFICGKFTVSHRGDTIVLERARKLHLVEAPFENIVRAGGGYEEFLQYHKKVVC